MPAPGAGGAPPAEHHFGNSSLHRRTFAYTQPRGRSRSPALDSRA
jgi:hypothetical protein